MIIQQAASVRTDWDDAVEGGDIQLHVMFRETAFWVHADPGFGRA